MIQPATRQIFTYVSEVLFTLQNLIQSARRKRDLILIFYLHATKSYQKYINVSEMNDIVSYGLLDHAAALFVQPIFSTLL
jgi:hypothetical protein